MTSTKNHALYLVKEGEHPKLFHGDDVEQARTEGWQEPDFPRSNGTEWNPESEQSQRDAAASIAKGGEKVEAKKAKAGAKK